VLRLGLKAFATKSKKQLTKIAGKAVDSLVDTSIDRAVNSAVDCVSSFFYSGPNCLPTIQKVTGRIGKDYSTVWNDIRNPDLDLLTKALLAGSCVTPISCRIAVSASHPEDQEYLLDKSEEQQQQPSGGDGAAFETNPSSSTVTMRRMYEMSYPLLQPRPTQTNTSGRSVGGARTVTHTEYEEHTVTNGEAFTTGEDWRTATAANSAHAAELVFTYKLTNSGSEYARIIKNLVINIYIGDDENPACTYFVGSTTCGVPVSTSVVENFRPDATPLIFTSSRIPLTLEQMRLIDMGAPIRIVVANFSYDLDEQFYEDAINSGMLIAVEDGSEDGNADLESYLIPTWGSETVLQVIARYFPHEADSNGTITAIWTPEYRTDTPSWCQSPRRPTDFPSKALWCKHTLSTADWWNVYTDGLGNGGEGFQDTPAIPGAVALFRFNKDTDLDGFSDRSEVNLGTDPRDAAAFPRPELLAALHSVRSGSKVTATLSLLNTGQYDAYGVEAVMIAPNDSISITNNTVGGSGRVRALSQVIVGSRIQLQTPLPAAWLQANHAKPGTGGYYTGNTDRTYSFTVNCPTGGCTVGSGTWSLAWVDGAGASGSLNFDAGYASPNFLPVGNFGLTLALYSGNVSNGETFTIATTIPRDTFQYTINRIPFTEPLIVVSYNDPQGNHRFVLPSASMSLTAPTDNLSTFAGHMLRDVGIEIVTSAPFTPGLNSVNLLVNNPTSATLANAHLFLEFINLSGTVVYEKPLTVTLAPGPQYVPASFNTADFSPAYSATQDYIVMAFWTDYQGNIVDTAGRPLTSFQSDPLPTLTADSASLDWDFGTLKQGTLIKRPVALANTGFGRLYTYLPPTPGLSLSSSARTVGAADVSDYVLTLRTGDLPLGTYDQTVTVSTSDPNQPTRSLRVRGTVVAGTADTTGGTSRPLDVAASFGANLLGTWQTFNHTLGPDAATLHPVKVFNSSYTNPPFGVGKFATEFGAGTASAEMFGDGRDGAMPGSGNLDNNNGFGAGVVNSGSAGSTSINVTDHYGLWRVNSGDVVLIHQTQGTGAGQWELNKAASDFTGSGTFSLQKPLQYTYSTSGNNKAQILRVPQYSSCNVTGTVTPLGPWNGSWGGIFAVMCNGTMTVGGSIDASARGFRGTAHGPVYRNQTGVQGEGYLSAGSQSTANNGNGGGGGQGQQDSGGGGGGGNGTAGANGHTSGQNSRPGGIGGTAIGNESLTATFLGGAGGEGGADDDGGNPGSGGYGGGIVFVIPRNLIVNGAILSNGGSGVIGCQNCGGGGGAGTGDGGGGSGGSILVRSQSVFAGNNLINALGGLGGRDPQEGSGFGWGGNGGNGRIRLEYCEGISGNTFPSSSTQKLNCYIADQASGNAQQGQLNIPSSTAQTYQIQYGRKLNFASAGNQQTQLRIPAGLLGGLSLQALASGLAGNTTLSLDVGADGSVEWSQSIANNSATTITHDSLTNAFSAHWAAHNGTNTGTLDVPIRVSLGGAGQVLLTNLQTQLASSSLRYVKLNAGTCTQFLLDFTAGNTGAVLAAIDIGDNGSIDWTAPAADLAPKRWQTGDLKTAVNAYLTGKSGEVEMPIRIYVTPSGTATLNSFSASFSAQTDVAAVGISLPPTANTSAQPEATHYNAGDVLTLQANLSNPSSANSGPLTAAFFAHAEGWGDWYVGSAFVSNIAPGGSANISTAWNTTGFGGNVPVKVVVNPYGRVGETNLANNTRTMTVTIIPLKVDQTIAFGELTDKYLDESPITINASASSGLTVAVTSLTPSVCAVGTNNNIVTLAALGTCQLRASQGGDLFFNPASDVIRSFAVKDRNKPNQTITFAAPSDKTYGDAPFAVSPAASSGHPVVLASETPSICTVAGYTVTIVAAGTCTIRATQEGGGTHNPATPVTRSFMVQKANQTLTFGPLPDRPISDNSFTVSATSSSSLPVSFRSQTHSVCGVSGNTVSLLSIGRCEVEATQAGNSNVNAAVPVVRGFNVTDRDSNQRRVYLPLVRK
jgi:hypothetical protein